MTYLLGVFAILIASVAAYFSVYGLGTMFTGAFIEVVIMGSVLEGSKLVAASALHHYWKSFNVLIKMYLMLAILVLMVLTSTGIYGFLSESYQKDSFSLKDINQNISLLEQERAELLPRKRQIDADIASLPNNYIKGRQRLMKEYGAELSQINSRLSGITVEIRELSKSKLKEESHTGPIIYIAKVLGLPVDNAINYVIILIIAVFDPLAVVLVICLNIAIKAERQSKSKLNFVNINNDNDGILNQVAKKQNIVNTVRSKN